MLTWETIGYVAATFGAISLIPEVLKALRTHHLQDLAWGMILLMLGASSCWFFYGFHSNDIPLMISAGANLSLEISLTLLKIHYSKKKQPLFTLLFHKNLAQEKPKLLPEAVLEEGLTEELAEAGSS